MDLGQLSLYSPLIDRIITYTKTGIIYDDSILYPNIILVLQDIKRIKIVIIPF